MKYRPRRAIAEAHQQRMMPLVPSRHVPAAAQQITNKAAPTTNITIRMTNTTKKLAKSCNKCSRPSRHLSRSIMVGGKPGVFQRSSSPPSFVNGSEHHKRCKKQHGCSNRLSLRLKRIGKRLPKCPVAATRVHRRHRLCYALGGFSYEKLGCLHETIYVAVPPILPTKSRRNNNNNRHHHRRRRRHHQHHRCRCSNRLVFGTNQWC